MKRTLTIIGLAGLVALLASPVMASSLSVKSTAALQGSVAQPGVNCEGDGQPGPCGLEVTVDNVSAAYVQSDHPNSESHFVATFRVNPGGLVMSNVAGQNHFKMMKFYRQQQPAAQHTFVYIKRNLADTAYRLAVMSRKDNPGQFGFIFVGEFFLAGDAGADHEISVEYQQSSGPGMDDGFVRIYKNGNLMKEKTGIDNDTYSVDYVRVGVPPGATVPATTSGYYYFDTYVSTR
jgi:hypothetical protein